MWELRCRQAHRPRSGCVFILRAVRSFCQLWGSGRRVSFAFHKGHPAGCRVIYPYSRMFSGPKKKWSTYMHYCYSAKGSCVCSVEGQTLTLDVSSKVMVYCRVPRKGAGDTFPIHSNFELEVFLKGKNKEAEISHCPVSFPWYFKNHSFKESWAFQFPVLWSRRSMAQGPVSSSCPGDVTWVCTLDIYNSNFSTQMLFPCYQQ